MSMMITVPTPHGDAYMDINEKPKAVIPYEHGCTLEMDGYQVVSTLCPEDYMSSVNNQIEEMYQENSAELIIEVDWRYAGGFSRGKHEMISVFINRILHEHQSVAFDIKGVECEPYGLPIHIFKLKYGSLSYENIQIVSEVITHELKQMIIKYCHKIKCSSLDKTSNSYCVWVQDTEYFRSFIDLKKQGVDHVTGDDMSDVLKEWGEI